MNSGVDIDIINEDSGASGEIGLGGGTDWLVIQNVVGSQLFLTQIGYDLVVTTIDDIADGVIDNYIIIQDQLSNINSRIEYVVGSDYVGYFFG